MHDLPGTLAILFIFILFLLGIFRMIASFISWIKRGGKPAVVQPTVHKNRRRSLYLAAIIFILVLLGVYYFVNMAIGTTPGEPAPQANKPPSATGTPTEILPSDVTIKVESMLTVPVIINCKGPYSFDVMLMSLGSQIIFEPSGTYTCKITADGYPDITKDEHWSPGEYTWTINEKKE